MTPIQAIVQVGIYDTGDCGQQCSQQSLEESEMCGHVVLAASLQLEKSPDTVENSNCAMQTAFFFWCGTLIKKHETICRQRSSWVFEEEKKDADPPHGVQRQVISVQTGEGEGRWT